MANITLHSNDSSDIWCEVDGIRYQFKVQTYDAVGGGYAAVGIVDTSTGIYYQSYGYIELNGHVFVTKWKREYDDYRDNYVYSRELIVEVD